MDRDPDLCAGARPDRRRGLCRKSARVLQQQGFGCSESREAGLLKAERTSTRVAGVSRPKTRGPKQPGGAAAPGGPPPGVVARPGLNLVAAFCGGGGSLDAEG